MKLIIEGDKKYLDKIERENRLRKTRHNLKIYFENEKKPEKEQNHVFPKPKTQKNNGKGKQGNTGKANKGA